mgnify:CR=1 FL=1
MRILGGWVKGSNRVLRGGSWNNNPRNARAANRNNNSVGNRNNNKGFRLAQSACRAGAVPFREGTGVPQVSMNQ